MQKPLVLLSICLVLALSGSGQSKMNFFLYRQVQEHKVQPVDVLIRGDVAVIRELVEGQGGTFKYAAKDIASVKISPDAIGRIMSHPSVKRMECYPNRLKPLNDTMLIQTNVVPVHAGSAPLPQAYDGSGVVMGIIDTGIDFTHPDFRDSAGNSRIRFLWDQTQPLAANTPLPYNYGQEWSGADIDSGLAAAHNDLANYGHGTHVAGIATGNGLATGTYKGVAPEADIVFVALDFITSSGIADATSYIYEKAAALGKPCVINASVGDYYGSHDGLNLEAQLIKNLINMQPGRSFVAAVGNGGTTPYHLMHTVTSDTSFTFFDGAVEIYIPMYADTNDLKFVDFAIGADQVVPAHCFRGNIPFSNISSHLGVLQADTLYNGSNRLGIIQSYGDLVDGVYSMEFLITPDSGTYNWRLMTTGTGQFDCWTFNLYSGPLPPASTMPDSIHYVFPDMNKTTVSSFQCLDDVISVGNYTNRKTYIDVNGIPFVNTATDPGVLHATSSRGPTRDGRIKPDICSPGDMTVAAIVLSMVPTIMVSYPDALAQGAYHVRNGGSSHASPSVAGIAALYLQKDPLATAAQIKYDILCGAREDGFTSPSLPDNNWGYGKSDAMAALEGCVATSVMAQEPVHSLHIYPNPTGGQLNIDLGGYSAADRPVLHIMDAAGAMVKRIPVSAGVLRTDLQLAPGIYICDLILNGNRVSSKKLVILH